jgi:two-component system phosphate regulon response regulator PhoB
MNRKILIIENDQDIRSIVEFILQEEKFITLCTPEPDSFTEILLFMPEVILIDEFINSKPGHRLCLRIKQEPLLSHIPVIILSTAHDIELIVSECKANDYIRKPFDVEEMVEKIVRVLDNHSLAL